MSIIGLEQGSGYPTDHIVVDSAGEKDNRQPNFLLLRFAFSLLQQSTIIFSIFDPV
ncbi:MAG: hypothetical protein U5K72_05585 [Balneolaceae bacterium]|nr:hypothetical protein [Balneolaceae bacterium]